jgi:hypothetical protein
MKGMKGTLTQWEVQLEAQLTAKLQDQLVWHWREQEQVNAHQQLVNAKGGDYLGNNGKRGVALTMARVELESALGRRKWGKKDGVLFPAPKSG